MKARQLTELYIKNTLAEKNIDTILKLDYKGGRGHFKINLLAVEKVADFAKILDFIGDSDIFVFDPDKKIEQIQKYVSAAVETLKEYRDKNKILTDDDSKKAVAESNTLLKRFISFNTKMQKRFPLYDIPDIVDDESTIKTKKLSYYIMIFDSEKREQTVERVDGFSFHVHGLFCGVHKCENGYYNTTLLCCGVAIARNQKSKKAAIMETLRILEKVNFKVEIMEEAAKHFHTLAEKVNADLSYLPESETVESVETLPESETVESVETLPESETVPTAAEDPETPETVPTAAEDPETPETVPTAAEDPETPIVLRRNVCSFTPLSPGERHAAAITQGNGAPPIMVIVWLYIAILQKNLFSVSHTLELCHVPVYGFTRVLYTVTALLLYRASLSGLLSGLPLFVVSNFKRDPVYTVPCTLYGFTSLRVLYGIETVSGLTRLTGCRISYSDTS